MNNAKAGTQPSYPVAVLIIGGTAAYHVDVGDYAPVRERLLLETPYGRSAPVYVLETETGPVGFTSRHGEDTLRRSARFVNHRANIWAAREIGVRWILSWNGVGSLRPDWAVGDLVLMHDVLDFTRGRVNTFDQEFIADRLWSLARRPFHSSAQQAILHAARRSHRTLHPRAIYACSEGPRLETAAEIHLFRDAGADVVGMTLCPEIWLAQELDIGYASLGYLTNHATGIVPTARTGREFGPIVAQTCFPILLQAAKTLLHAAG